MRNRHWTASAFLIVLSLASALAGCGDKDENAAAGDGGSTAAGDAGGASPNLGEKSSIMVTAAAGGSVELAKAGVKLDIPAGALAKDTKISAEVVSSAKLPGQADLAGEAIEFLPKGLTFEKPVALSIDLGGAKAPEGTTATISWLDEETNEWVNLEGAKVEGGAVIAETTHFTIFMIRFVVDENGNASQDMGMCSGDFKACGGDVEGTWNITSGCADVPASLVDQVTAQCKGSTFTFGLDVTGDITFAAGKITAMLNTSSERIQVMPKTCLGGSCDDTNLDPGQTVTDLGDSCEDKNVDSGTVEVDGTYTIDAAAKSITIVNNNEDAGGAMPNATEYCVTGDTLVARSLEENGMHIQWTATRQ